MRIERRRGPGAGGLRRGLLFCLGLGWSAAGAAAQDATPCESDADCEAYRVCELVTERECPEGLDTGCREGESDSDCTARSRALFETECATSERTECVGNWDFMCNSDERCGEGFQCSQYGNCEPVELSCERDEDCLGGWFCASVNVGPCEEDGAGPCGEQEQRCTPPVFGVDGDNATPATGGQSGSEAVGTQPSAGEPKGAGGCAIAAGGGGPAQVGLVWLLAAAALGRRRMRARVTR